ICSSCFWRRKENASISICLHVKVFSGEENFKSGSSTRLLRACEA
ncbi:hypothetical protein GCK32_020861, partial [Trichostrongylus colubriformis]